MAWQRVSEGRPQKMMSHLDCKSVDYEPTSLVANFYANKSVFITGATGFIGKAIVEKLLRSCREIGKIYLLIREKRDKDVKERLADLLKSQIFDAIRKETDGIRRLEDKVIPIEGDITLKRFGISDRDMKELAKEVSVVFNSAATIRFSEPIEVAVTNNISSISNLMEFCDSLDNLKAIVHLSTAYSNCNKSHTIHEIFYEPPMRGDEIMSAVRSLKQIQSLVSVYHGSKEDEPSGQQADTRGQQPAAQRMKRNASSPKLNTNQEVGYLLDTSQSRSDKQPFYRKARRSEFSENDNNNSATNEKENFASDLLDEFAEIALRRSNRPNTYCFTKAISEYYLLELCKRQPNRYLGSGIAVGVLRPSIVGGAWREPLVGFVDNYNGATGAMLSLYTGALQAMPGCGERVADLVPVDMVANLVCCVGWFLGERGPDSPHAKQEAGTLKEAGELPAPDKGVYIFNFVSGLQNPMLWRQVTQAIARLAYLWPSAMLVRLPSSYFVSAGWRYDLYDLLNHKLVAWLVDFVRERVMMQKLDKRSSCMYSYGKIRQMTRTLTPFTSHQWRLSDTNVRALYRNVLSPVDKEMFAFDIQDLKWDSYIRNYIIGSRVYALKDDPANMATGLSKINKKRMISRISMLILTLLFYYIFLR